MEDAIKKAVETVRGKCIVANPEIKYVICNCGEKVATEESGYHHCGAFLGGRERHEREIRLADVLLAMKEYVLMDNFGDIYRTKNGEIDHDHSSARWDLKKDDLSLQSEETVRFLGELLN